jgi:DNA polymerase elongation subunit (family B)
MAELKNEFRNVSLDNILFLDIETVSQQADFSQLEDHTKALWEKKAQRIIEEGKTASDMYPKAGIFAEFGKIVCISVGYIKSQGQIRTLRIKSFFGDDEKKLLIDFNALISKHFNTADHYLCAHNGKEFDFPYIARRTLIHGLAIPACLDTRGLKPWEVKHFDTLELWRFGDYKNYTSLETLTHIFNIPSPKDDITGAQVGEVYWKDKDSKRIATYCQKDVIAIVQLFLRFKNERIIEETDIVFADLLQS